jgi:Xaa-Pro dipeptidase
MSVPAEFPREEFEGRWRRAREGMGQRRLDALLITSEANYRYLSGHYSGFWISKARPMLMLLPSAREPTLLMTRNQVPLAETMSPVKDIRSWEGFMAEAIPALADAIKSAGLERGRIGAELGFKQRLGMPVTEFHRLESLLPNAAFVDAADLFWSLRLRKSPREVAYLRESIRITCEAYAVMFATVRPGMTEREAHRTFLVELFKRGAERPGYIPVTSGPGNYERRTGGPSDRKLEPGDLLWFDGGCSYMGYWSDLSRMVAIQGATAEQMRAYRDMRAITHACLEEVGADRPIAAIDRRARAEFKARGLRYGSASRVGHGIGLDHTEPPSLREDVEGPLEAGMVLSIEPTILADHGLYQVEELYVVTESGYTLLTQPAADDLPVVA